AGHQKIRDLRRFLARRIHVDVEDGERKQLLARVAESRTHAKVDVENASADLVKAESVRRLVDEGAEQLRIIAHERLERPAFRLRPSIGAGLGRGTSSGLGGPLQRARVNRSG